MDTYICGVSGVSATGTEDDGNEEGIPVGWTAVTLETRTENPAWKRMMAARAALVEQMLKQLDDEAEREKNREFAETAAHAQFAALEQITPRYVVDERRTYVCAEQLQALLEFVGETDE